MLVRTGPHWWGPFEVGEVPDEGQELIIGDVESSGGGGGGGGGGGLSSSQTGRRGASGSCFGFFSTRMGPWWSACFYGRLS